MRSIRVVALTLLITCTGALSQPTSQIPQGVHETKKEIAHVLTAIVRGLEMLNADTLFQSYANTPEFMFFMTDGSMAGYEAAKEHHVKWFASLSALRVTTVAERTVILPGDMAVCAWRAHFAMVFTTGGKAGGDLGITLLFVKSGGVWRVAYQQTAQYPPAQKPAGK